jgi:hypothetical protein
LNAQEYEAEAGDNYQESEFEILTAVKKSIPRPDALRYGHRDDLNRDDEEEDAAKAHRGTRSSNQCV